MRQSILPNEIHDFLDLPNMISDARRHRGRHAQGLMDAREVVVHEVERDRVGVVLDLLGEGVRETRESVLNVNYIHPRASITSPHSSLG